jgi:hypothetical protein
MKTPEESILSARQVCMRLAQLRERKSMHAYTLSKAIKKYGLPCHVNPFGPGWIFYWSEIEAWLQDPQPMARLTTHRSPGRARGSKNLRTKEKA